MIGLGDGVTYLNVLHGSRVLVGDSSGVDHGYRSNPSPPGSARESVHDRQALAPDWGDARIAT